MSQTAVTKSSTKSAVTFSRIFKNGFQKPNTLTVEVKQTINNIASYPSIKVDSDLNQTLADASEFQGSAPKVYSTPDTRVAWMVVPDHYTEDIAKAKLAALPECSVYKILSNEPILDENQIYAINQGLKSKDDFANTQAVRYPEGTPNAGKLILDKAGNPQYRVTKFWKTTHQDEDYRGTSNVYLSPEIDAELHGASVLAGQSI